jgi:hypothetical protein
MSSYHELLVQRMLLEHVLIPEEPEWTLRQFSAYLKDPSLMQTRSYIVSLFDAKSPISSIGEEGVRKIESWLAADEVQGFCNCDRVVFVVPDAPTTVNACGCSICRRYGAMWVHYPEEQVTLLYEHHTETFYGQCNGRRLSFSRCIGCGCVTHCRAVDKSEPRIAVNARLIPAE